MADKKKDTKKIASKISGKKKAKQVNASVDQTAVMTGKKKIDEPYLCTCCGKRFSVQDKNFYKSSSPLFAGNGGFVNICRPCADKYFDMLVAFFCGEEERALERICQLFDLYYSERAVGYLTDAQHEDAPMISLYLQRINLRQISNTGKDYLQTLREIASETDSLVEKHKEKLKGSFGSNIEDIDNDVLDSIPPEVIRRWPKKLLVDEYEYLEEQYSEWCARTEVSSKSQEELIKAICIAQLNVRNAQTKGGKVAEAMKALTDLMASCNLTPKQESSQNQNAVQASFGQFISMIEQDEPIPEPQGAFKDPDGIRKYVSAWFYGPLAHNLKIKNANSDFYEEEMRKYTVLKPEEDGTIANMFDTSSTDEGQEEEVIGNDPQSEV